MARSFCVQFNLDRKKKPKCGAKRKTDGEPCQNLGMENGRCFRHGGKTPRGDNWHVTQWPDKRHPFATTKMEKKLQWQERRATTRAKRVAQMTPDELAAFELWKQTHKPGKAAARELKRQDARNSADFRARSETNKSESVSQEAAELRAYRLHLEAEYQRLQQLIDDNENLGAFG